MGSGKFGLVLINLFFVLISGECKKIVVKYVEDPWWGPEHLKYSWNDTSIRPFKIVFEDEMIQDLRYRLLNYKPSRPSFPKVGFDYGFNTREMPSWLHYWANEYPFQEREEFLNQYPHYKTNIQGLDIHFMRVTPQVPFGKPVVPLLLMHGWPGSIREFYETMPHLTAVYEDRDFAVEVIAPSLPGFGFSDASARPGLDAERMATVMRNLMHRLGHHQFYVQGGDWGGLIGSCIATLYPTEVLGFHTNFALVFTTKGLLLQGIGALFPPLVVAPKLAGRMYPLLREILFVLRESGYLHMHATKPDTMGVGLSDSPGALLAYILQIMSVATRRFFNYWEDGGLSLYPRSTLVDNLMVYWSTNSISTAIRIYTETFNKQFSLNGAYMRPTPVPTWAMQARWELLYQSPRILKTKYHNLIHTSVLTDGGHFMALEMPKLFAYDVLNSIEAFRKWHRKNRIKLL